MRRARIILCSLVLAVMFGACVGVGHHAAAVGAAESGDKLTPGKVEMSIRKGMPQADVLGALGNPNIVSTDAKGQQVWTWDRMSTSEVRSAEQGGVGGWLLVGFGHSSSASASHRSQRTMTLIIYFDEKNCVRDLAYHSSSF